MPASSVVGPGETSGGGFVSTMTMHTSQQNASRTTGLGDGRVLVGDVEQPLSDVADRIGREVTKLHCYPHV